MRSASATHSPSLPRRSLITCARGASKAQDRRLLRTIWAGVVLRAAKSVRELPVWPEIVQGVRNACAELRLIGKARKRARGPTPEELEQLRDYFAHRDKRPRTPMLTVLEFALASARRESEICRLEWQDKYTPEAWQARCKYVSAPTGWAVSG
jgi:integrase